MTVVQAWRFMLRVLPVARPLGAVQAWPPVHIRRTSIGLGARSFSRREAPARVPVLLREEDLEESFVKGWGKGGQKINKVRNCVLLKHAPSGLHVRCQETRSLDGNRRIARKLLLQKLDDQVNGAQSKQNQKIARLRKKKAGRRAKAKQKYATTMDSKDDDGEEDGEDIGDEEEEGEDSDEEEEEEEDVDEEEESEGEELPPRVGSG